MQGCVCVLCVCVCVYACACALGSSEQQKHCAAPPPLKVKVVVPAQPSRGFSQPCRLLAWRIAHIISCVPRPSLAQITFLHRSPLRSAAANQNHQANNEGLKYRGKFDEQMELALASQLGPPPAQSLELAEAHQGAASLEDECSQILAQVLAEKTSAMDAVRWLEMMCHRRADALRSVSKRSWRCHGGCMDNWVRMRCEPLRLGLFHHPHECFCMPLAMQARSVTAGAPASPLYAPASPGCRDGGTGVCVGGGYMQ